METVKVRVLCGRTRLPKVGTVYVCNVNEAKILVKKGLVQYAETTKGNFIAANTGDK